MFSSLRRRKRGRDAPSVLCVGCRCRLLNQSYASLTATPPSGNSDCSHTLCFSCFVSALVERDSREGPISCPSGCRFQSRSWQIYQYALSKHKDPTLHSLPEPIRTKPNAIQQPIEHFASRSQEYRRQKGLITFLTSPFDASKTRTYSAILQEDGQHSEVHADNFASIGESLHPFLQSSVDFRNRETHSAFTNTNTVNTLEREDYSDSRRFVHGIATGKPLKQRDGGGPAEKLEHKEATTTFVALDLIRTAKGGDNCRILLKNAISDLMVSSHVSSVVVDFLCSLGLNRHQKNLAVTSDRAVKATIEKGWKPKGRGYGVLQGPYDNMGFRKKTGYKQFTLLAVMFYSVKYMINLGVYPNPELHPDVAYADPKYLCSERREWNVDDYIFEIKTKDAEMMLSFTLSSFEWVIDVMNEKHFPTVDEAREFIQRTNERGVFSSYKIPYATSKRRSVRAAKQIDYTDNVTFQSVDPGQINNMRDLDDDEFDDAAYASIYDINNTIIDLPLHRDLNSTPVVEGIVNYYTDIADTCLTQTLGCTGVDPVYEEDTDPSIVFEGNPWAEAGWPREQWPVPWMGANGPTLSGDGSPSFAMLRLQQKDNAVKAYTVLNSGFHSMLEILASWQQFLIEQHTKL